MVPKLIRLYMHKIAHYFIQAIESDHIDLYMRLAYVVACIMQCFISVHLLLQT